MLAVANGYTTGNAIDTALVGVTDTQGTPVSTTALKANAVADGAGGVSIVVQCGAVGGISDGEYTLEFDIQATGNGERASRDGSRHPDFVR